MPNHLLKTIRRFGLTQGYQIGYRVDPHFELSIKPNHQVYKCTITGTPDTGLLSNYSAKLQLNYLNLPINLNYAISFSNRMGVNAEVGFNTGYLSKYIEDMEAIQLSFASPDSLYKFHSNFTGQKGYSEFYENGYRKVNIATDKERYQKINLGLTANIGIIHNISDKFRIFVSINSTTGLSDVENKTVVEATYYDIQGVHKQSPHLAQEYARTLAQE